MHITIEGERGSRIEASKGLQGVDSLEFGPATVLTGSNGSGKSSLLDGIAAAAGLGERYRSSETKYSFSSLDMTEARRNVGGISIDEEFDLVLRFRGEEARAMPMALDTTEDFAMVFRRKGSHGESSLLSLHEVLKQADEYVKEKKGRLLLLLDEPETGAGPDLLFAVVRRLTLHCLEATLNDSFRIVIATQSPFVLQACTRVRATRMDLGQWRGGSDPFPRLLSLLDAGATNE